MFIKKASNIPQFGAEVTEKTYLFNSKVQSNQIYNVRLSLENTSLLCDFAFFFFKEHTNRWRYIFPISALTAASTFFVRTSVILKSLVLTRRGHVQHQPGPLRGRRTNTGPRGRRCVSAGGGASLLYKHLGDYFRTSVGLEREKKKQQENNTKSFGPSGEAEWAGIPRFQVTMIKTQKEGLQFEPSLKVNWRRRRRPKL